MFLIDAVARYLEETGEKSLSVARTPYLPENFSPKGGEEPGIHAKTGSSHLIKLFFAARLASPDLAFAITRLACKVTSWNESHDRALRRLMQYAQHAEDLELVSELSSGDLQMCRWVSIRRAPSAHGCRVVASVTCRCTRHRLE